MNIYTKKFFIALALCTVSAGLLFTHTTVSAATCCMKYINNEEVSCRPYEDSHPCETTPIHEEACKANSELDRTATGGVACRPENIIYNVTAEIQISCNRNPAKCGIGNASVSVDCSKAMNQNDPIDAQRLDCANTGNCFYAGGKCFDKFDHNVCTVLPQQLCGTNEGAKPTTCQWNTDTNRCLPTLENVLGQQYGTANDNSLLSTCALQGTCRSINDIVVAFIKILRFAFGLAGSIALAAFVYGGLLMILSFGNAERVEQGKSAMVAAVIGLAVSFGAFVLIGYILTVFSTKGDFKIF